MSERWTQVRGEGEPEQDDLLAAALRALDPATDDPNYWLRFRAWVTESAAPELARRRLLADLTVGDVLTSWARTVVPTALMAAAMAALLLVRQAPAPAPQPAHLSVEELLTSGLTDDEPIPAQEAAGLAFASERF